MFKIKKVNGEWFLSVKNETGEYTVLRYSRMEQLFMSIVAIKRFYDSGAPLEN